jgi:flotillin
MLTKHSIRDKVPFRVDVVGFFRIANPIEAAEKIESFEHLHNQLKLIINGAIRTVLSSKTIIEIMEERSTISQLFNARGRTTASRTGE